MAKLIAVYAAATFLLPTFLVQNISARAPSSDKISPVLQASLSNTDTDTVEIVVSFGGTGNCLEQIKSRSFNTRPARLQAIVDVLQKHAAPKQEKVLAFLSMDPSIEKVVVLWISNQVYVKGVTAKVAHELAEFEDVTLIKEVEYIPLEESVVLPGKAPRENVIQAEWGVEDIRAPEVWNAPGGNTGEGVIIATQDTGARWTHETLRHNYAGYWLDPYNGNPMPMDANGHGTHVMSTIVGHGGVGVAPGAKWIACRGCDTSICISPPLISCAQWFLCPNENCTAAPDIVSNSWGGGRGNTFYDEAIEAFHAAGIIPVFSNGNSGSACNTANSPADSRAGVLGIGSTTRTGALSSFSSRGPSIYGDIKPDICAPGSSINAAYHTSDTAYAVLSGTSMSAPHAAGAIALLKSACPSLTYHQVKYLLETYASRNVTQTGQNCGGIPDHLYPNHSFGAGKVDVFAAFNAIMNGEMCD